MMSIISLLMILVAFVGLLVPLANAVITATNDVSVKVDKENFKFGQITCRITGLCKHSSSVHAFDSIVTEYPKGYDNYIENEKYAKKRNNVKIVTSSQLEFQNNGDINELTDITDFYTAVFSKISNNKDSVNVTLKLNVGQFFGPKFYERIDFGTYGEESDNGYTKLEMGNAPWEPAGPYFCIVINNDQNKVLGASKSFTVSGPPDPVIIKVLTTSVLPGQTLKADVYNQNFTLFENFEGDYIRIYKVPYDVSNNRTELNTDGGTAKFVGPAYFEYLNHPYSRVNYSSIVTEAVWTEPGKYQIVMLSDYNQVFRGISNVFQVGVITRTKNTTITINTNSTFPGHNFIVSIYKPDPPYGAHITVAYIKANETVAAYTNGTKEWVSKSRVGTWNSTTTYLNINTYLNEWRNGLYKVVVLAGDKVIAVSKPVLIKRPNIQVPSIKRTYSQWETMPTTIIQPDSVPRFDRSYSYEIISKSQPDSYYSNGGFPEEMWPDSYGYQLNLWQNATLVTFAPGLYNIRLVVHKVRWYDGDNYYKLDSVVSIPNTTFRVIQNKAQIMIANNKTNFKYGDFLNYSFTTANKVSLHGPIPIHFTSGKSYGSSLGDLKRNSDSNGNTTINLSTLYGSIRIEPYWFGCPYGQSPYNIQLLTRESSDGIENVNSSIISIDPKSAPKNQCKY